MALPFKLIPARHRLDLIDEKLQERLLEARRAFASDLPKAYAGEIAFFDFEAYNPAATIQDNILFGKIDYGQANAEQRVGVLLAEVLDGLGMRDVVMRIGLKNETGPGGSRLSPAQRQKLAIGRCLLRKPVVLLLNEAAAPFDTRLQGAIVANVLRASHGRTVVWSLSNAALADRFDQVLVMERGRVVEHGSPEELRAKPGGVFGRLVGAGDEDEETARKRQ